MSVKYKKIASAVIRCIKSGKYPKGGLLPSESFLSEKFGVSRITARNALALVGRLGHCETRPGKGRFVVENDFASLSGFPKRVACVSASRNLPSYGLIYNEIRDTMDLKGFEAPLFFPDGGSISNLKDKLLSEEFAGVISIGVPSERMRGELPLVGIPVVTAAFDSPDFLYCVATDDYTGGWMAGRHILSKGHRKIIILRGNNFRDPAFLRRENGFRGAADACSEKTELLRIIPDFIEQANRDRFFEFLKKGFTAVFLTSDMIMERLLPILNEAGVGVPDDISLMGYDNLINNRDISGIPIDSVDQPWREIASEACRLVFSAVSGKIKGERVFIRPRIVKKNTVTENKKME